MTAGRAVFGRVALVIAGTAVGVFLLEAVLQAAALYIAMIQPREAREWLRGGQRIVALGDSNTFGFFLQRPAVEAYPQQIQEQWNARDGAAPIEVLNLGVPGMNSSKLRAVLPEIMRVLRPDVVLVMVGVNDFWIAPVSSPTQRPSLIDTLRQHSRVARLTYMMAQAIRVRDQREPPWDAESVELKLPKLGDETTTEVVLRSGNERVDLTPPPAGEAHKQWREDLETNIVAMTDEAARHGVRLIVLTYPAEGLLYDQANRAMRKAAGRSGATLIDIGSAFLKLCPNKHCEDLFFFDLHPRAKGHQLAAQMIVDRLQSGASMMAAIDQLDVD